MTYRGGERHSHFQTSSLNCDSSPTSWRGQPVIDGVTRLPNNLLNAVMNIAVPNRSYGAFCWAAPSVTPVK